MSRGATEMAGTIGLLRGWGMIGVECARRWVNLGVSLVGVRNMETKIMNELTFRGPRGGKDESIMVTIAFGNPLEE